MCDRTHTYTVEIVGQPARYTGRYDKAAILALLVTGIDSDTGADGCVTAEHEDGSTCPAEGDRIADAAEAALAERDARATPKLTRAEDAYAHLASFQRGDSVEIQGRQIVYRAVVMTPQQHDYADINRAHLIVSSDGTKVTITVGTLLAGHHTITGRGGNVRYFDAARYVAQDEAA